MAESTRYKSQQEQSQRQLKHHEVTIRDLQEKFKQLTDMVKSMIVLQNQENKRSIMFKEEQDNNLNRRGELRRYA